MKKAIWYRKLLDCSLDDKELIYYGAVLNDEYSEGIKYVLN